MNTDRSSIRVHLRNSRAKIFFLCFFGLLFSCSSPTEKTASNTTATREEKRETRAIRVAIKRVEPFFKPMGKPESYDWLGSHNEPGQTFDEYLDSDPTKPTSDRQKIYVLPLGTFTTQQMKIIEFTTGYLGAFYDLNVEQMPQRKLQASLPHTRQNRFTKTRQIKTVFILNDVLIKILPHDAAALIAFTNEDLYPDDSMNYVFGQASLEDRVGVWSLSRLDDNANYDKFLRRTLKIAVHETGHMFSMRHCTKYECVMSGTNQLAETDRRPIDACPECMAKICWLSNIEPVERYKKLADFCRRNSLLKDADEFSRKAAAVNKN